MDLIDPCRKIVIELRYAPDLAFYGKMDSAALQFSADFPDWERSPLTVEVRNKKKHRRMFLANRRCFFESDLGISTPNSEYEAARGFLERICTDLNVEDLERIGVRQWFAANLNKPFALMVDEIADRFLKRDANLSAIFADQVSDLSYVVDYETTDGWKYHLRLGPMTRDEWFQRVSLDKNLFEASDEGEGATLEAYRASFPENFLYIDLDCYQEKVPVRELKERILTFHLRSHELAEQLIKYCQG